MPEQAQETQPQNSDNGQTVPAPAPAAAPAQDGVIDLTPYYKEGDPGSYDDEKLMQLVKDLDNQKKSTSYFQSLAHKKNGVPDTAEAYMQNFKADTTYEKIMADETAKAGILEYFKWAKENNIGVREAQLNVDFMLKQGVQSNMIDLRTPEMLEAEAQKRFDEELKVVTPMLQNLNRTLDENNKIIDNFLASKSIFTNNPEMKAYIDKLADSDPMGYMFVTLLTQAVEHRGIPVVTGTVAGSKDEAAFRKEYAAETDPLVREKLAKAFYGDNQT